ncbi:MAG: hypothetical protein CVV48_01795 [Spirochaetae bacterium HGW-Spirochaetae-4]|nr:MAG: hypothetical protein CVV48_01795 [Spirochaetae bacterium HGW-Spirochaetae-4]
MNNTLKVRFKLGVIEFEAEGLADDVEREREAFKNTLFPLAIEAMSRTQDIINNQKIIEDCEGSALLPAQKNSYPVNSPNNLNLAGISLNEFITQKGFRSKMEYAIGLIYYFERVKGYSVFSCENLKEFFTQAKEKPPINLSDYIKKLINPKAFIMPVTDKGMYQITRTGIDFVEKFVVPESQSKKSTKVIRVKEKSIFSSLDIDTLNLKNYPEIKSQKLFRNQMILILFIVSNEGKGDEFSTADVQCLLIDKLGLKATKDQVNGVFKNRSWFTIIPDATSKKRKKRKLLTSAKDYAKSIIDGDIR